MLGADKRVGREEMSFFTEEEVADLRISRMNFQIVGEDAFEARPAMRGVEHADFFLGRILDIDVGAAFEFQERSNSRAQLQRIARGTLGFAPGATALAADFHDRHVGQSKPGAFFVFDLECGVEGTRFYALLKYDYSEVLTLRRANAAEQLRRVVHAFVKDKRALQKSALVRVVRGDVEGVLSCRDRAEKAPDITDFFAGFLGVFRNRDDVELNRDAVSAVGDIAKQAPKGTWPDGEAQAIRVMRQALRDSVEISEEAAFQAVFIAAGRPQDVAQVEGLRQLSDRAWRRRRLLGLAFRPDPGVIRVVQRRRIKTVDRIQVIFPDELSGVKVMLAANPEGDGAVITIRTDGIESNEIDNESLGNVRRLAE
jgi:hypothetical protein